MVHTSLTQFAFQLGDVVFFAPKGANQSHLQQYGNLPNEFDEKVNTLHVVNIADKNFDFFAAEITFLRIVTKFDAVCFARDLQTNRRFAIEMYIPEVHPAPHLNLEEDDELRCYEKAILQTKFNNNDIIVRPVPNALAIAEESPKAISSPERVLLAVSSLLKKAEAIYKKHGFVLRLSPRAVFFVNDHIVFSDSLVFIKDNRDLIRNLPYVGFSSPFWATELFLSSGEPLTNTANTFAAAAVAYFLISGALPPSCKETDFYALFGPRTFRHDFPLGWDDLLIAAMCPHPKERPNPEEFLDAMREQYEMMQRRTLLSTSLNCQVAVDTHIGVNKRLRCPVNQDAVFVKRDPKKKRILMAVADGVSTAKYGSGDIASHILTETAENAWKNIEDAMNPKEFLDEIIENANAKICNYLCERYGLYDLDSATSMGTTALLAYIENNVLTIASIGDSRCYIFRNDETLCITRDHNLCTMSIVEGASVKQAVTHPYANALTQCLGLFTIDEEGVNIIKPPYDIYTTHLLAGDNVLLTTDGLIDCSAPTIEESEEKIADILLAEHIPGIACQKLIVLANRGGGRDNIGVGLIRVTEKAEF